MVIITKSFIKSLLPTPLVRTIQRFLFIIATHRFKGLDIHLNFPDRRILEEIIIPYFVNKDEFKNILFVGCDWYTKPYKKYFKNKNYWSIDIDPRKKIYGANKHITDSIEKLNNYIDDNYFDVIFLLEL